MKLSNLDLKILKDLVKEYSGKDVTKEFIQVEYLKRLREKKELKVKKKNEKK